MDEAFAARRAAFTGKAVNTPLAETPAEVALDHQGYVVGGYAYSHRGPGSNRFAKPATEVTRSAHRARAMHVLERPSHSSQMVAASLSH